MTRGFPDLSPHPHERIGRGIEKSFNFVLASLAGWCPVVRLRDTQCGSTRLVTSWLLRQL
jgi:hypothetical protein